MSTVNKLLAKAMSTQSEDEAISALRLARKRHKGGNIDLTPEETADKEKWVKLAKDWYKAAKKFEGNAEYWYSRYREERVQKVKYQMKLDKLEHSVFQKKMMCLSSVAFGIGGIMMFILGLFA